MVSESLYRVTCQCMPGYEGSPPTRPCTAVCPGGQTKDAVTGECTKEITCIQTSCSPGVCQQPGPDDDTPPCLCPDGTRYLWERGVCAIIRKYISFVFYGVAFEH